MEHIMHTFLIYLALFIERIAKENAMKKYIIISFLAVVVFVTPVGAEEPKIKDGVMGDVIHSSRYTYKDWSTFSKEEKYYYVLGYVTGHVETLCRIEYGKIKDTTFSYEDFKEYVYDEFNDLTFLTFCNFVDGMYQDPKWRNKTVDSIIDDFLVLIYRKNKKQG